MKTYGRTRKPLMLAAAAAAAFSIAAEPAAVNLLSNPGFAGASEGGWTDRSSPRQSVGVAAADGLPAAAGAVNALKVSVVKDGGKNHGQIIQFVDVRPGVKYTLSAWVRGDAADNAYISVKQMKGGREGARASSKTNSKAGAWEKVVLELNTAPDTTRLQFLMRFRMNAGCVGKNWYFAAPSVVAADGLDAAPKAYEPPKPAALKVKAPGADAFVAGDGAGKRDGSSWADALPAARLQEALDRAGPGCIVFIAAGEYAAPSLTLSAGGASPEEPVRIIGVAGVGGARPVFKGDWRPESPARGTVFMRFAPGAGFVAVENIELRNVRNAVVANGPNHGLRFKNVDVRECRDAFTFAGGATAAFPEQGSRGIVLDGCEAALYTKRMLRTQDGVSDMRVVDCVADAGGPDYVYEVFPVGFHITGAYNSKIPGVKDRRITFENCEARGNWHKAGVKYWNADGWAAERNTEDLAFINCRAFNNTDGGWDLKSRRVIFKGCVSIANKRNYRVWPGQGADGVVFENCLSAYSHDYGARGHDVGFWILGGGSAALKNCTAWEDRVPFKIESGAGGGAGSALKITDSILTKGAMQLQGAVAEDFSGLLLAADAPRLKAPANEMAEPGDAFNCVSHPGAGFKR